LTRSASIINQLVFLPNSNPYGQSFEKWTQKWWKWLLTLPKSTNPANDATGTYCAENQADPDVWFLAGTLGGTSNRHCTIPVSKAIVFPIIIDEQSFAEKPELNSDSQLEFLAKKEADQVIEKWAEIDGNRIFDLERVQTGAFDITLPEDNIWGVKAGPTRAAADGYWLFLKPLARGKHTIHFSGRGPRFATEVVYDLEVEKI
jgi:hypothetical protein